MFASVAWRGGEGETCENVCRMRKGWGGFILRLLCTFALNDKIIATRLLRKGWNRILYLNKWNVILHSFSIPTHPVSWLLEYLCNESRRRKASACLFVVFTFYLLSPLWLLIHQGSVAPLHVVNLWATRSGEEKVFVLLVMGRQEKALKMRSCNPFWTLFVVTWTFKLLIAFIVMLGEATQQVSASPIDWQLLRWSNYAGFLDFLFKHSGSSRQPREDFELLSCLVWKLVYHSSG